MMKHFICIHLSTLGLNLKNIFSFIETNMILYYTL